MKEPKMTLHEIASVLWCHGEREAYRALLDHIKAFSEMITELKKPEEQHDKTKTTQPAFKEHIDELMSSAWEEAYIRACELDSPNSPDFDALHERIYQELFT